VVVALFALLVTLVGCGGGTRGTGDELRTAIIGTLKDTDGSVLAGATVTQLETGDSTTTDESGSFSLDVQVAAGRASLIIERGDFQATTELTELEADAAEPTIIAITVDLLSGIVVGVEIEDSSPIATPTPGPRPSPSPNDSSKEREHLFRGLVVDLRGAPIAGVAVSVRGSGSTTSDSRGRFELKVRTSSSKIRVTVQNGSSRGSFDIGGLPTNRNAQITIKVEIVPPSGLAGPALERGYIALTDLKIR
jgi:iron complex outermembrane receptor protein